MFWRKSQRPESGAAPSGAPEDVSIADKALDTIALLLRTVGENAFDVGDIEADEIRERCESWASKIVVGTASGGDAESDGAEGALRRDWGGLRRFFVEHRQAENEYVRRSFRDFREALRVFAQCVTGALTEDAAADDDVGKQLEQLAAAVGTNETEAIKEQASRTVDLVSNVIARRKDRQTDQLARLRERVDELSGALEEARESLEHDALTQLFSRAALDQHLARLTDLGLLLSAVPSLLIAEVDDFGRIESRLGKTGSDMVLRRIADTLTRSFLRREDFVARFDERAFAVVITEDTFEAACGLAERAHEALQKLKGGDPGELGISIGLGQLQGGEAPDAWLGRAARALATARERGGDLVVAAEAPPARDSWAPPRKRLSLRASRRAPGRSSGRPSARPSARPLSLPRPSIRIIE